LVQGKSLIASSRGQRLQRFRWSAASRCTKALKSLGVDIELVIYPNQFHGITVPSYKVDRLSLKSQVAGRCCQGALRTTVAASYRGWPVGANAPAMAPPGKPKKMAPMTAVTGGLVDRDERASAGCHANQHSVDGVALASPGIADAENVRAFDRTLSSALLDRHRMCIDRQQFAFHRRFVHEGDDNRPAALERGGEGVPGPVDLCGGGRERQEQHGKRRGQHEGA
jgi:hypothetical protein